MFVLSAPPWKHKRPKPRKKCPDKLIMALDLRLSIRLHGIKHLTKQQGISIKPLGLMLHSISGLSSGLYQPITVAILQWASYLDAEHDGVDDAVLPATTH